MGKYYRGAWAEKSGMSGLTSCDCKLKWVFGLKIWQKSIWFEVSLRKISLTISIMKTVVEDIMDMRSIMDIIWDNSDECTGANTPRTRLNLNHKNKIF